jgi:hypothetical protein
MRPRRTRNSNVGNVGTTTAGARADVPSPGRGATTSAGTSAPIRETNVADVPMPRASLNGGGTSAGRRQAETTPKGGATGWRRAAPGEGLSGEHCGDEAPTPAHAERPDDVLPVQRPTRRDESGNPLPKTEPLAGSLHVEYKRCGRLECRCTLGKLHGPYTYRHVREQGRQRKRYVPAADREHVARALACWRELHPPAWRMRQFLAELRRLTRQLEAP